MQALDALCRDGNDMKLGFWLDLLFDDCDVETNPQAYAWKEEELTIENLHTISIDAAIP